MMPVCCPVATGPFVAPWILRRLGPIRPAPPHVGATVAVHRPVRGVDAHVDNPATLSGNGTLRNVVHEHHGPFRRQDWRAAVSPPVVVGFTPLGVRAREQGDVSPQFER